MRRRLLMLKSRIVVSPEMLTFSGLGCVERRDWPLATCAIGFSGIDGQATPILHMSSKSEDAEWLDDCHVVFIVQRAACERLFGTLPADGTWHLPGDLRRYALAIRDCEASEAAKSTLRLARSIELLCQTFSMLGGGGLIPSRGDCVLNEIDAARIAEARRIIEDRWQEKLTLESIGRACGLNRDKLARGFRLVFNCSVSDLLAEKRLSGARQLLIATDLPISTVGYRCGYLNNASFTRAFSRRFGVAPSHVRMGELAA
jgi:AraC family transcriptional activator of pyochelin receptor